MYKLIKLYPGSENLGFETEENMSSFPEFWEPCIKVGDKVVVLPEDRFYYNSEKECIATVESVKETSLKYSIRYDTGYINSYDLVRLATPKEIEESKLMKVGDFFVSGNNLYEILEINSNSTHVCELGNEPFIYNYDIGYISMVYKKATKEQIEKGKEESSITIVGYKPKVEGSLIAFGCNQFTKEQLLAYKHLLKLGHGRNITVLGVDITSTMLNKLINKL